MLPQLESIHHPAHGRVLAVRDLDPMRASAATIGAVPVFAAQAFESHTTCRAEQVGANFALLEGRGEYAIRSPSEESGKVRLPHSQGQTSQVFAIHGQHVEGVKLDLVVVLAMDSASTSHRGEQVDAVLVNDQPEAVVFDLMNPLPRGRHLGATGRDGGLELHAAEICMPERYFECSSSTARRLVVVVAMTCS